MPESTVISRAIRMASGKAVDKIRCAKTVKGVVYHSSIALQRIDKLCGGIKLSLHETNVKRHHLMVLKSEIAQRKRYFKRR